MDLNGLKERFNLQKLAEEFKAVIDDQPVVNLDKNNPVGQGVEEILGLIKDVIKLQDQQRKSMDQVVAVLGAVVQKISAQKDDVGCQGECQGTKATKSAKAAETKTADTEDTDSGDAT